MKNSKKTEENLLNFKKLVSEINDVAYICDVPGNIVYVNKAWEKFSGHKVKEFIGKSFSPLFDKDQLKVLIKYYKETLKGKKVKFEAKFKDTGILVEYRNTPMRDASGKIIGVMGIGRDITEQKKTQDELMNSEERLRLLFQYAPDAIYINDLKGNFVNGNKAAEEMTGYKRNELIGKSFLKLKVLPTNQILKAAKLLAKNTFRQPTGPDEFTLNRKDGSQVIVEIRTFPVKIQGQNLVLGIARDITKRKKTEEEIIKFKTISDKSGYGNAIADLKGNLLYVNKMFVEMHGYQSEQLIGKHLSIFHNKEQLKRVKELNEELKNKGGYNAQEVWHKRKDNTVFPTLMTATLIKDNNNKPLFMAASTTDITKQKKVEEEKEKMYHQLIHSEKMAGVGTLSSGVTHEFNNVLQIISGRAESAKRTGNIDDIRKSLDIILDTSGRGAKIVKDLLTFTRQETLQTETCNITEPIESVLSITEPQLTKRNIKVVRDYSETPNIEIDKSEIQQVFLNLVINARDSMLPEGGKLEISVKQADKDIEIKFSDNGKGIKKENLKKVFEPFFTTKGILGGGKMQGHGEEGTGLGLSVSYGLIQRHGGTISVESEEGKGTTFTIKLPIKEIKTQKKPAKKKAPKIMVKPKKVLVIDDEIEFCNILTDFLTIEGCTTKHALTGQEALKLLKKEQFNVVFLDLLMPGIQGEELLGKIRKISPKTKVIIVTGQYMNNNFKTKLKHNGIAGYIEKPFKMDEIIEALNELDK